MCSPYSRSRKSIESMVESTGLGVEWIVEMVDSIDLSEFFLQSRLVNSS